MASFIEHHCSKVTGMISGWDRLRFRGTVRMLANVPGLGRFLRYTGRYLLQDFGRHAEALEALGSTEASRFLGHKVRADGGVRRGFASSIGWGPMR